MAPPGGSDAEVEIVQRDGYTDVRFLGDFSVEGFQRMRPLSHWFVMPRVEGSSISPAWPRAGPEPLTK